MITRTKKGKDDEKAGHKKQPKIFTAIRDDEGTVYGMLEVTGVTGSTVSTTELLLMRLLSNVLLMAIRDASLIRTGLKSLTESHLHMSMLQGFSVEATQVEIGARVKKDISELVTDAECAMLRIGDDKETVVDLVSMKIKGVGSQAKITMHREASQVRPLETGCRMMTPIFNSKHVLTHILSVTAPRISQRTHRRLENYAASFASAVEKNWR